MLSKSKYRIGCVLLSAVLTSGMMTGSAAASDAAASEGDPEKAETVYVIADAEGTAQEVLVSDWLKNPAAEEKLADETILDDIENLKGNEEFSETGDGRIVWDAQGNDIFYRGSTDKELPVSIKVTYMLDGQEISPEELAGKSGEVTIRYTYENNEVQEAKINGETYPLHVPFAAVTFVLLDEGVFSDISITNGQVVSDGEHLAVLGIAFPGLAQDLETEAFASLTKLVKADVPDYVELTAHAENISLNTAYTVITNELLTASGTDLTGMIDDVFGKIDSLGSGIDQIADGVSGLKDGAGTLKTGAADVAQGLSDLADQNEALQNSGRKIFETMLSQVQEQLENAGIQVEELNADNYQIVLEELLDSPDDPGKGGDSARTMIEEAEKQLNDCKAFYDSLVDYTDGVASAGESAGQVSDGVSSLESSASGLSLVCTILQALLPDLTGVPDALKETVKLTQDYRSFTGIADGVRGKVRFIWKISGT